MERVFYISPETSYDMRTHQCIAIRSFAGVNVTKAEFLAFRDAFLKKYDKYVQHVNTVSQLYTGDFCCIVRMDVIFIPELQCNGLTRDGQMIPHI